MNPFTRLHLAAVGLALCFTSSGHAQSSSGSFYDINLGSYPGIVKLERGVNPGIASGSHAGYYIRFGEDIANLCAKYYTSTQQPRFRLNVFATQGSLESLKRLRKEDEVQLAVVQSDLYYYAKRHSDPEYLQQYHPSLVDSSITQSWGEIEENIALILPLFTEKIHILVRPDDKTSGKYTNLIDLFEKRARVNIGSKGSGTMVTCTLLEQLIAEGLAASGARVSKWTPRYMPDDVALDVLVNGTNDPSQKLDAVIFVGAVPYPALEKFGVNRITEKMSKNLFKQLIGPDDKVVADMALLPFGERVDELLDSRNNDFKGYLPVKIQPADYPFLQTESEPIATRGVTACLVTHAKYNEQAGAEAHKIRWVRHILYRILSKLDETSTTGLDPSYGTPLAGARWKEVSANLRQINSGDLRWSNFGWSLHTDAKLREMLSKWGGAAPGPAATYIDPDSPF